MIKLKVLKTTDGKHVGKIFEVPDLNLENTKLYTGGKFRFDYMKQLSPTTVRLWSSNYTAIVKIVQQGD